MKPRDFDKMIEEVAKAMSALHNRLLRIEEWMLRQDKGLKDEEGKQAAS